jgi:hypothetical protein
MQRPLLGFLVTLALLAVPRRGRLTCLCGALTLWRKRQCLAYGVDWAERVSGTRHRGQRDDASMRAALGMAVMPSRALDQRA